MRRALNKPRIHQNALRVLPPHQSFFRPSLKIRFSSPPPSDVSAFVPLGAKGVGDRRFPVSAPSAGALDRTGIPPVNFKKTEAVFDLGLSAFTDQLGFTELNSAQRSNSGSQINVSFEIRPSFKCEAMTSSS